MSEIKVNSIKGVSASSAAISINNTDGTCTANVTNIPLRNLFINGALDVSQRGNSYASANAYTADQWYVFVTGVTATRVTTSPPDGFTHYIRFPSATNSPIMSQQIELEAQGKAGKYKGKTVTVSWYARSESSNKMYVDAAFKNASGGGDYTTIVSGSGSAQDITSSWARYTQTFTISVDPHANNKCFSIMIRTPSSGSGSTGTLELTGFQAEFGSVATDFEHRSFTEEFNRCLRYYEQFNSNGLTEAVFASGYFEANGQGRHALLYHKKRAAPTITASAASTFMNLNTGGVPGGDTITIRKQTETGAEFQLVAGTDGSDGNGCILASKDSTEATIKISAEL